MKETKAQKEQLLLKEISNSLKVIVFSLGMITGGVLIIMCNV